MRTAFTHFVRSVEPGEPHPAGLDEAWKKLHDALIGELRKRSLWHVPPSALGISGFGHWSEPGALDELTADCFTAVLLRRLPTLKALVEEMENIEGLVFRNIRNFLHDTQKKHNPLDYRIFEVLRAAVRRSIAEGRLRVVEGDPKILSATILSSTAAGPPRGAGGAELAESVRSWGDDLLPELVTAKPAELDRVEERLCLHLERLPEQGVEVFRFQDVLEPLRSDLRRRWSAIWQRTEEEREAEVELPWLVGPDSGFEERDFFDQLILSVDRALARVSNSRTRAHLEKLWAFLRSFTAATSRAQAVPGPAASLSGGRWSGREIANLLDIPRYRLPELYETLREEVERCGAALRLPLRAEDQERTSEAREPALR